MEDIELTANVRLESTTSHVTFWLANYTESTVAVRLTYPLPDHLVAADVSPDRPTDDAWTVGDDFFTFADTVDWASGIEREFQLATGDREVVDGVLRTTTLQVRDTVGTDLGSQTGIDTEYTDSEPVEPDPRATDDQAADPEPNAPADDTTAATTDAQPSQSAADTEPSLSLDDIAEPADDVDGDIDQQLETIANDDPDQPASTTDDEVPPPEYVIQDVSETVEPEEFVWTSL